MREKGLCRHFHFGQEKAGSAQDKQKKMIISYLLRLSILFDDEGHSPQPILFCSKSNHLLFFLENPHGRRCGIFQNPWSVTFLSRVSNFEPLCLSVCLDRIKVPRGPGNGRGARPLPPVRLSVPLSYRLCTTAPAS